jgi:hypothetical protein
MVTSGAADVGLPDPFGDRAADGSGRRKSGPKSRIERQLEAVRSLPRAKQKFVSEFLETVLQAS